GAQSSARARAGHLPRGVQSQLGRVRRRRRAGVPRRLGSGEAALPQARRQLGGDRTLKVLRLGLRNRGAALLPRIAVEIGAPSATENGSASVKLETIWARMVREQIGERQHDARE